MVNLKSSFVCEHSCCIGRFFFLIGRSCANSKRYFSSSKCFSFRFFEDTQWKRNSVFFLLCLPKWQAKLNFISALISNIDLKSLTIAKLFNDSQRLCSLFLLFAHEECVYDWYVIAKLRHSYMWGQHFCAHLTSCVHNYNLYSFSS